MEANHVCLIVRRTLAWSWLSTLIRLGALNFVHEAHIRIRGQSLYFVIDRWMTVCSFRTWNFTKQNTKCLQHCYDFSDLSSCLLQMNERQLFLCGCTGRLNIPSGVLFKSLIYCQWTALIEDRCRQRMKLLVAVPVVERQHKNGYHWNANIVHDT